MRRRAFTVLELLVVIALIAFLAGLAALAAFQVMGSSERQYDRLNWHTHRRNVETKPRSTPHRILFIGNSYTEVNHLPDMVQALFTAAGDQPKVEVQSHLVGGATLEDHWNNPLVRTKIVDTEWDFVVLQEQSMRPLLDRKAMHDYARKLDEVIHKHQAITLFYET